MDLHDRLQTITLSGEFDFCNKDMLTRTLRAAEDSDVAIIDMTDVRFMDSSAMTCLISLKKTMVERGGLGTVRLMHVNKQIARVLNICGLDKVFDVEPA